MDVSMIGIGTTPAMREAGVLAAKEFLKKRGISDVHSNLFLNDWVHSVYTAMETIRVKTEFEEEYEHGASVPPDDEDQNQVHVDSMEYERQKNQAWRSMLAFTAQECGKDMNQQFKGGKPVFANMGNQVKYDGDS